MLLNSYCSAYDIRRDRWLYHLHKAKLQAAYKEMNEAADEVFDKSDDEEDIASFATAAPRHHDHEADMSVSAADNKEE